MVRAYSVYTRPTDWQLKVVPKMQGSVAELVAVKIGWKRCHLTAVVYTPEGVKIHNIILFEEDYEI